jgi:hypothetical protein
MAGFECADHLNAFKNRVDFLNITRHLDSLDADYRTLELLNIRTVREGIRWSQIERSPHHYNWAAVKRMIECARYHGTTEKLFVKFPTHAIDHYILGIDHGAAIFSHFGQKCSHAFGVQTCSVKGVDGIQIDRNRNQPPIDTSQHAVLILPPLGKAGKVVENIRRVGVEDMRTVTMN